MDNISLWKAISQNASVFPKLTQELEVDVAIVGGGITGVTAALQLINAKKRVAIIEANTLGVNTTGYSTGNLYVPIQPYFQTVAEKFGIERAKIIAHSRKFAMDYIEKQITDKNIQCNFSRRPWYLYTDDDDQIDFLKKEVETFKQMDFDLNYVNSLPLSLPFKKCALLENQSRFNPLQYVIDLGNYLKQNNCFIFENSRVTDIQDNNPCVVTTEHGKVIAKKVLIATHTPIGVNPIQFFTAPYRSYVVAVHDKENSYPEIHCWDLGKPHHATCTHAVTKSHPELLLVAGSHHKVGQDDNAESHYQQLTKFLEKHFSVKDIAYRWSAQHYHSADSVPYIGFADRFAKNTYIATGYFADGLVYGTLAGVILSDLILEKENPLAAVYNSNRFDPIKSTPFLSKETFNIFMQYMKDFPFTSSKKYDDVKAGEGKVVEINNQKCAVSRDENNQLHIVSAVCTHMKCIVNWNNAERTWDCPCHGSRFQQCGKVIEGPAKFDLKKMEE